MTRLIIALMSACVLFWNVPAEAHHRHHHHHYRHYTHHRLSPRIHYDTVNINESVVGGRPSGCPFQFCGCGTSLHIFGKIIPALNRAAEWFRFPHASPAPGMVAVRNHHVFAIERVIDQDTVVAYDSNSGRHLTRVHVVSLRGYSVRDPHGMKVAWAY